VPLTEREKQILQDIEANLYTEDPGFARGIRQPWWHKVRQVKFGAALFVVGLALLMGFFVTQNVIVGVFAFMAMVGGIVLMSTATGDIARDQIRMHKDAVADRVTDNVRTRVTSWQDKFRSRYKKRP
jgi:uncharacterized membrane protein